MGRIGYRLKTTEDISELLKEVEDLYTDSVGITPESYILLDKVVVGGLNDLISEIKITDLKVWIKTNTSRVMLLGIINKQYEWNEQTIVVVVKSIWLLILGYLVAHYFSEVEKLWPLDSFTLKALKENFVKHD